VGQPILLIHFGVNGLLPGAARVAFPAYHDSDSRLGLSPCQRSSFRATMPDCVYPLSPKSPKSPGVRLKPTRGDENVCGDCPGQEEECVTRSGYAARVRKDGAARPDRKRVPVWRCARGDRRPQRRPVARLDLA